MGKTNVEIKLISCKTRKVLRNEFRKKFGNRKMGNQWKLQQEAIKAKLAKGL